MALLRGQERRQASPLLISILSFCAGGLMMSLLSFSSFTSSSYSATALSAQPAMQADEPCVCPVCPEVQPQPEQQPEQQAAPVGDGTQPQHFCPWDVRHSAFIEPESIVDFGRQQTACLDAIVYGYDLEFERRQLWRRSKWLGVPMMQDPSDSHVLQELMWQVKPDVVIELGTNTGGGALWFASILSLMSPTARVITIDPNELDKAWMPGTHCTDDNPCLKPEGNPLWQQRVTFIQGLPDSPEVLTQVQELINKWGAKTVFVSEDSSHMYDTVLSNLKTYAKFVTSGSYLLAQDTKLTRFFKSWECQKHNTTAEQDACWNAGRSWPGDAAADFLASPEGADFATDREPEYLYYTQHAGGYMRKK